MKVVILGCGPAGLLAAHACYVVGGNCANVKIISMKQKSPISGAQYIHRPVPGIPVERSMVTFKKMGTRDGYAAKVYGDHKHECSWDKFPVGEYPCWSMKETYDWLWNRWEDKIVDRRITIDWLEELEKQGFDLMVSSIPKTHLCMYPEHKFEMNVVKVISGAYDADWMNNFILYNGDPAFQYYRSSFLFGNNSMEYGADKYPMEPNFEVRKPQSNTCDCREKWLKVGRYGKWQRGVLAHTAFEETQNALYAL